MNLARLSPPRMAAALARRLRRLDERSGYALTWLWRRLMVRTTVIAITGSTGKTTAKECLFAILSAAGPTIATLHNENDETGVPRTIQRMRPWHRFAVIEVGTHGPGIIRRSTRLVRPDIAVVLHVGRTHTRSFPTLDDTAAEKAELVAGTRRGSTVILNFDDERVAAMAARAPGKVVRFGQGPDCELRASAAESPWPERFRFELAAHGEQFAVRTRLVGTRWLTAVLAALAAAGACGVPVATAVERLGRVPPFMGRMQPVSLPSGAVMIRDEETASPDTVAAMMKVLREAHASRRGLVFSDVSDVRAKDRKRVADIAREAAQHCDYIAFVGSAAHHGVRAAVQAGLPAEACRDFVDLRDAAAWLREQSRPGDLVFLKGRITDHLSRILFAQYGDVGCWKSGCTIHRLCDVCPSLRPGFDLRTALVDPLVLGAAPPDAAGETRSAAEPAT